VENSIEEDIKCVQDFLEYSQDMINDMDYERPVDVTIYQQQINSMQHILSDYKRVLKENQELKQDRNNNYQMIALAQNEVLGYMQGYEDGKKLKRSAVACVVENQQYYIIKKEIEHYKEYIEKLQKENEELKNKLLDTLEGQKVIKEETPQYIKENFIPVQKIKDKIEKLNDESHAEELEDIMIGKNYTITELVQYVLQELIEESEEK
jgi:hypothetical protein